MKKYKITELLLYYLERYKMRTDSYTSFRDTRNDEFARFRKGLIRTIKKSKIGEISLWDAIKQEDGTYRISVEEFERLCFREWCRYIEDNCEGRYDKNALEADKKRYNDTIAIIQATNAALESGEYDYTVEDVSQDEEGISDPELKRAGYSMMLEAIYDTFFEPFQWEKLQKDMEATVILSGSDYNREFDPEIIPAIERLGNYKNYIGKRRE